MKKHQPQCVFLMETKCNAYWMERLCKNLEFHRSIYTEARGLAGGIILMWKEEVKLKCRWKTEKAICGDLWDEHGNMAWSMVACYGTLYLGEKDNFWKEVELKLEDINNPWILFGDLNEVVNASEKLGGREIWKQKTLFEEINAGSYGY